MTQKIRYVAWDDLVHITIDSPKKVLEGKLAGTYTCEVYLPDTEKKHYSIYADNPIDAADNASKFIETYLQNKIDRIEKLLNEKDIRQKLTGELE